MSETTLGIIGLAVVALGSCAYLYGFIIRGRSARWLDTVGLCCALFALALLSGDIFAHAHDPRASRLVLILLCVVTLAQGRAALSHRRRGPERQTERGIEARGTDVLDRG